MINYQKLSPLKNTQESCSLNAVRNALNEYSVSHSTQTAPYTHARLNRLLFAKRQRGIFKLHGGCANTQ